MKKVALKIKQEEVIGIGYPGYPFSSGLDKDVRKLLGRQGTNLYKDYQRFCSLIGGCDITSLRGNPEVLADHNEMKINIVFDDVSSNTFKFLGMDVNEDGDCIVKSPIGNIVVGNLYEDNLNIKGYTKSGLSPDVVRRFVTNLKMGGVFTLTSKGHEAFCDKLRSESDVGGALQSIILSLITKNKRELEDVSDSSNKDFRASLSVCINNWKLLVDVYNTTNYLMKVLGMWQEIKKLYNDVEYFDTSSGDTWKYVDFSGFDYDNKILSDIIIRRGSSEGLRNIGSEMLSDYGSATEASKDENVRNFLMGCFEAVDSDDSDDLFSEVGSVFDMSLHSLTAASILDGMTYQDENADLVRRVYNMSDSEERDEYVRAAISSYKRKYSDYTPISKYGEADYGFVEEITSLVEDDGVLKSDMYGNSLDIPVLSSVEVDDSSNVTISDYGKFVNVQKDFTAVAKLIGKVLGRVVEIF